MRRDDAHDLTSATSPTSETSYFVDPPPRPRLNAKSGSSIILFFSVYAFFATYAHVLIHYFYFFYSSMLVLNFLVSGVLWYEHRECGMARLSFEGPGALTEGAAV